jgi:hypothetical protein
MAAIDFSLPMVIGITIRGKSIVFFKGKMGRTSGNTSLIPDSSSSSNEKSGMNSGSSSCCMCCIAIFKSSNICLV